MLKVFFHDRCFDGTTSAALFGRFYRDVIAPGTRVDAVGVRHRVGDPFEGVALDADDHACVDFRYSPDPAMRWWFDHHLTAFQPPSLRETFEARRRDGTQWFDPAAPSCAGLIMRALGERWGWTPPPALAEAVAWADVIDAARFGSAEEAASLGSPAQRLGAFLGEAPDPDVPRYVAALGDGATLAELDGAGWVRATVERVLEQRARVRDRLAARAVLDGDVVVLDLLDEAGIGAPGFVAYALFPACRYTVAASRGHASIRIGVGYNPWCGIARDHDVGALCQRFGGGGHAAVGGVTLEDGEADRARATLAGIAAALLA